MSCSKVKGRLVELLYDDLDDEDRVEIKAHVDNCDECRGDLEALRGGHELLRLLDEATAS